MSGLTNMIDRLLERDPASFNTDWDGTLVITALLEWGKASGDPRCSELASEWFGHHKSHTSRFTDEQYYASYIGVKSRLVHNGPIPFSAYCGHWGLVYPLPGIAEWEKDGTPQEAAAAVADYILHSASRSFHGCAFHDDGSEFLIPDTCYFTAPCLAIASHLTGRDVYLEHAVRQLKAYVDLMQDPETGLAFTLWSLEGMPRKFWSRASGWLAGALLNTLAYVPREHNEYEKLAASFRRLIEGVRKLQRADGGFHVLLDRPDAPVDCTGPAMLGLAMKKGARMGLVDNDVLPAAESAWEAASRHIGIDGFVRGAYTGWAKSAVAEEFGEENFDHTKKTDGSFEQRDFVSGLMLLAAAAFYE